MEGATATNNGFVPLVTVVGFHHARYVFYLYRMAGRGQGGDKRWDLGRERG